MSVQGGAVMTDLMALADRENHSRSQKRSPHTPRRPCPGT